MPSPFPGMNPYLEQPDVWLDFHQSFIAAMRDALVPQIMPRYIVKIEEQLYIHEPPAEFRRDQGVGVERQRRLEIRDRESRQLITVVELLIPINKSRGVDSKQYEARRSELLARLAHFVEIDLLRGGPRMPRHQVPASEYCVLVSRYEMRPTADFWPIRLRAPLPLIGVPLRADEGDATLDLQSLLHRVYDAAGYGNYIYDEGPVPPLSAEDAMWAKQFLPAAS
jgi:Protein of unknown function (DUF4058)